MVDSSDVPIHVSGDSTAGNIYKRTSGTWSSSSFSDDSVSSVSPTFSSSDLYAVYETGGVGAYGTADDIRENHAGSWNGFDTSAETTVASGSDTQQTPSVRWQYYNANDPSSATVDIIYHDNTNSNAYYASITQTKVANAAVASTTSSGVNPTATANAITTPAVPSMTSASLNPTAVADAIVAPSVTSASSAAVNPGVNSLFTATPAVPSVTSSAPAIETGIFLTGQCTLDGSAVQGAKVHVVRTTDDTYVGSTTSASDGSWSLKVAAGETYICLGQLEQNSTQYETTGKPYVST